MDSRKFDFLYYDREVDRIKLPHLFQCRVLLSVGVGRGFLNVSEGFSGT